MWRNCGGVYVTIDNKKEPDWKAVGQRLRDARASALIPQTKLAERIGCSRNAVRILELDTATARLDVFVAACQILNQDTNYVLGLEPKPFADEKGVIHEVRAINVNEAIEAYRATKNWDTTK